jgi:AcrR family transcriptional regulator
MAKDPKELWLEQKEHWREQLAEARREQILEAAAGIFAEKGFYRTTTKEIAAAAGVSEGTIYNYFESKKDLLLGMMTTFITESIQQMLTDSPPDDPRATLTAVYRNRLELLDRRGHLIRALFPQVFTNDELRHQLLGKVILPLAHRIEAQITAQSERGLFRPVNATIVTRAMMGFLFAYMLLGLTGEDPVLADTPHDEIVDELVALFLDGLRVRPEQKAGDSP